MSDEMYGDVLHKVQGKSGGSAPPDVTAFTLHDLAEHRRWVAWREVWRNGKATKVPYNPKTSGPAKANKPSTWGSCAEAQECAERLRAGLPDGTGCGIGLILGTYNGVTVAGIDLDTCRNPETGELLGWAREVVEYFPTYAEVSPSGTGAKLFFMWHERADGAAIRQAMGTEHSRLWKLGTGGDHPPGIELHLSNRYFTVTGQRLPDAPEALRHVPIDDLLWVVEEAGPALAEDPDVYPDEPPRAAKRKSAGGGRDNSRSGKAWRIALAVAHRGGDREAIVKALEADPDAAAWLRDKGQGRGGYELDRLCERAIAAVKAKLEDASGLITEGSVAEAFAKELRDGLRYCHERKLWFEWVDTHWRGDRTKRAYRWAHGLAREMAKRTNDAKTIVAAGKASFAGGVERLAQAHEDLATTAAAWDADPWALGTPGGTVDLRTGILRPAAPGDGITKQTAVAPSDVEVCPRWKRFLREATGGDDALIDFLQQWFGYTLTGDTREHAILFVYGTGKNGKGVAINTVAGILDGYARSAALDAFTSQKAGTAKGTNDIAELVGARMVLTTEIDKGKTWDESRINQVSGGDAVTARLLYANNITFTPTFKLTISGNHQPALRTVNEAAQRRFNIVPFKHVPPDPDPALRDKLRAEWPGILRWMINGCLDWQQRGLVRPDVVTKATGDYFEAQDTLGLWVAERCKQTEFGSASSTELFRDWAHWAREQGEEPGTNKSFSTQLEQRFTKVKSDGVMTFKGLTLKAGMVGAATYTQRREGE